MITESAVWHESRLFTGKRHGDCIRTAVEATGVKPVIGLQGFVTNTGRFLDRVEAAKYAIENGQITELKWPPLLYSEDLWR